jgi:hypothetical protein
MILNAFKPSTVVGPMIVKHNSGFGILLKSPVLFLKASVPCPFSIFLIVIVSMIYFGFGGKSLFIFFE